MILAGIDIGLDGAVTLMDTATGAMGQPRDMPTLTLVRNGKNKRELDIIALVRALSEERIGHAFVEAVSAMPGQGVTSMFSLGRSYGTVLGILATLGTPITKVAPITWKKALQVPAEKDGARARASELFPGVAHWWALKKHDGRAESALIAEYGRRHLNATARAG